MVKARIWLEVRDLIGAIGIGLIFGETGELMGLGL